MKEYLQSSFSNVKYSFLSVTDQSYFFCSKTDVSEGCFQTPTHPHIVYMELGEGKSHTLDPSRMLTLDISINRSGAIQSLLCFKSM